MPLGKMIKIYLVPSKKITREYLLIRQGLINNAHVEIVNEEKDSDFVFFFYTTLKHYPEYLSKFKPEKTIFIDYHDRPGIVYPVKCKAYFKRSWVTEERWGKYSVKRIKSWPAHFHPITFAVMDEFLIEEELKRDIILTCTIRPHMRHINRQRILKFLQVLKLPENCHIGELNTGNMDAFNDKRMRDYFKLMKRSRIVVTCNPGRGEGDHRTWEAFASGACVFIDKMYTPMRHPFIDYYHCNFYELSDWGLEELKKKIFYFIESRGHCAGVAQNGFEFAMKYHRASNRIDEILEIIT